ncbi:MAG: hypothetical protein Kow0069_37490 [Promethearchaeota archaeon]
MPVEEVEYSRLVFDRRVRQACVTPRFACPHHGHSWACPPAAPYMEDALKEYDRLFLVHVSVDASGKSAWKAGAEAERRYWAEVASLLERRGAEFGERLVFGPGGSCGVCNNPEDGGCTHDDGLPCRYPERRTYSMEAVGIDVTATARACGLVLDWPPATRQTRVGLVAFKEREKGRR